MAMLAQGKDKKGHERARKGITGQVSARSSFSVVQSQIGAAIARTLGLLIQFDTKTRGKT